MTLCLLGTAGIHGWFPVTCPSPGWDTSGEALPQVAPPRRGLPHVVGGLEVAVRLAHQEDRERVLHAGRSVGWAPQYEVEARDWEDAGSSTHLPPVAFASVSQTQKSLYFTIPLKTMLIDQLVGFLCIDRVILYSHPVNY